MKFVFVVLALSLAFSATGSACEGFKSVPQDQAQAMLDTLGNPKSKPLERVFAFQTLACSDLPAVRRVAMEQGLKGNDPILRGQVLLEILMQKDAFSLELLDSPNLPPQSRENIKRRGGSMLYNFRFKDRAQGCISIGFNNECDKIRKIVISGDKVQILDAGEFTDLQLQPDNTLRGTWKRINEPPIPARIILF